MMLFKLISLCCVVLNVYGQGTPPTVELNQCTERIWAGDNNSFTQNEVLYDLAGEQLFLNVSEEKLLTGVYPYLIDLLQQFNPVLGEPDPELTDEIDAFLDALLLTEPMKIALECLNYWGFTEDEADFKSQLLQYWFLKYSRSEGLELDSSGFENTFQGEIDVVNNEVIGFYNWIHTYLSEQNGNFTHGSTGRDCGNDLVQINDFQYLGAEKDISSLWIRRSPEFEVAIYTVCFMVRWEQNCNFEVNGGQGVTVINWSMEGVVTKTIGNVYTAC